jgi:aminoglycoside phosphotransferase/GTP:adenosylcobinamide-phosphate guanylyltransferase
MDFDYIIIQAGGKGTRLGHLTRNKPKGIVPFGNLPVIFHLFRRFPEKKFIVIGDYLHEILERYLEAFSEARWLAVRAGGCGTCGGISRALAFIPENTPFLLVWSDLILPPAIEFDGLAEADYIGISEDFECRWSYKDGVFAERASKENGVAGFFIFRDKKTLADIPESGELVRFFSENNTRFKEFGLKGTKEIGTPAAVRETDGGRGFRCRAFNRMEITGDTVTKIPVDGQGKKLAARELAWYREAAKYRFGKIPEIISFEPFVMRRIKGNTVFRAELGDVEKKRVIDNITASLKKLHGFKNAPADIFSIKEAYYTKTINRLEKVRALVPFADNKTVTINGKKCANIYFYRDTFRRQVERLLYDARFALIHGDCTFSNTMVDSELEVTFLDPRGYFGFTELYGDTAYDWAKVFYSVNGDYDQFNNGNFVLDINDADVSLKIGSNGWKHLSDYYLEKIPEYRAEKIKFIHAVIWLSLAAYAWEDYDSVCGAFYNGLLLMDEFLREETL